MDQPWSGRKLHFVGMGGAGMSGLAVVAHALGADHHRVRPRRRRPAGAARRRHRAGRRPRRGERAGGRAGRLLDRDQARQPRAHDRRARSAPRRPARRDHAPEADDRGLRHPRQDDDVEHARARAARRRADPSYLVGGEVRSTGANAGWGAGEWLVVEADESDRSLLKLSAEIAVVTNAELDHHTTYSSRRDVDDTFRAFLAQAQHAVVPPELTALARARRLRGRPGAHGRRLALRVRRRSRDAHRARRPQRPQRRRRAHRRQLAGADVTAAAAALATSQGAGRRFEPARHDRHRRPRRRRLRAPPDRGRGDDRRRPHARSAPRRRALPAAPLLAHPARSARVRSGAGAAPTCRWCSTSTPRARPPRTSPASPACSSPRPRPMPAPASASPGCATTRRRRFLRTELRQGDLLLTMGAGDVDSSAARLLARRGRAPRGRSRPRRDDVCTSQRCATASPLVAVRRAGRRRLDVAARLEPRRRSATSQVTGVTASDGERGARRARDARRRR